MPVLPVVQCSALRGSQKGTAMGVRPKQERLNRNADAKKTRIGNVQRKTKERIRRAAREEARLERRAAAESA